MIERSIMITLLSVLEEQAELSCGTEENALCNDLNLRSNRPLTPDLIREHLGECEHRGWADWRLDSLRAKRWRITPIGRGMLRDFQMGG